MEITIPEYIDSQPFHAYYMTVSGHLEYNFHGQCHGFKEQKECGRSAIFRTCQSYIATQIELDRAMEYLLAQLRKGIADKTLIAMSSDHYPYGLEHHVIEELAGHKLISISMSTGILLFCTPRELKSRLPLMLRARLSILFPPFPICLGLSMTQDY